MYRIDHDAVVREASRERTRFIRELAENVFDALCRAFAREAEVPRPAYDPMVDRLSGLATFQARLKNSRPPRIAFIRASNRSKCSGTSTKFRRSLFTMSSGLSE